MINKMSLFYLNTLTTRQTFILQVCLATNITCYKETVFII